MAGETISTLFSYISSCLQVGHAIRDATASVEARKKRRSEQAAARKSVVGSMFARSQLANPSSKAASKLPSSETSRQSKKSIASRHEKSILPDEFESAKVDKLLDAEQKDFLGGPLWMHNPEPDFMYSELPKLDVHPDKITASNMWRMSAACDLKPVNNAIATDAEDPFLAYIDQVLGPLPTSV